MNEQETVPLLALPGLLAAHGYRSVQLCHFLMPTTDEAYLHKLRAAFADAGVELECFLVDDGDLTHPSRARQEEAWISGWVGVGEILGARRTRVIAGKQPPTPTTLNASGEALARLAARHPRTRIVTENWHALLPTAGAVLSLLEVAGPSVGFLIDLGNWTHPDALCDLALVGRFAETCQAKCRTLPDGSLDVETFAAALRILHESEYEGSLALVYDGPDEDEFARLEEEFTVVDFVFGQQRAFD